MKIKAVFFDLFETLISEYENGSRKAPRSTLLEEKLGIDSTLFKKLKKPSELLDRIKVL